MAIISGGQVIEGSVPRNPNMVADKGLAGGIMKMARAVYDFAVEGGAVGAINLLAGAEIPSGAVILGGYLDVITVPTSAGAPTLGVQVEGTNDVVASALISGAPWSTTGRKSVIPAFTGATSVKTTAAKNVVANVGTAALTAGKFEVVLFYVGLE